MTTIKIGHAVSCVVVCASDIPKHIIVIYIRGWLTEYVLSYEARCMPYLKLYMKLSSA